jgi:tetratricopeptide (TPR) repeat protein
VALSLNNLALLYYHQARYAEAEPLFQRSIAILEGTLGPEDPSLIQRLDNYAALLRRTGRPLQATSLVNRAQAIRFRATEAAPR